MNQTPKRSDEPIFWGLFGAGGMWSAVVSPVVILLIGIILPLSFSAEGASATAANIILFFFNHFLGKLILIATIVLPFWCGVHRIHHTLHDLKIEVPAPKVIFYFPAAVLSCVALVFLFI